MSKILNISIILLVIEDLILLGIIIVDDGYPENDPEIVYEFIRDMDYGYIADVKLSKSKDKIMVSLFPDKKPEFEKMIIDNNFKQELFKVNELIRSDQ